MSENIESRSRSDSSEVAFRKIFIGGLSYSTDEEKLKKYFKAYGSVQDAVVMKDPVSKRSRGFGFITFYDVSSVDNALANEPHTIDSRKVEAKRAVPRSEIAKESIASVSQKGSGSLTASPSVSGASSVTVSPQVSSYKSIASSNTGQASSGSASSAQTAAAAAADSRHALDPKINMEEYAYNKIFVGGLHYDTRDAEFRAYFEKYGKVISAEVMFNRETHKSRGFGFIVFELESGAVKVCAEKEHSIDGKVVEVKRAIPRSKITVPIPSVSPGTATGKSLGSPSSASTATTATSITTTAATPTAPVNIRTDVRRTMSEETPGSAKVVTNLPPPPLSSILSSVSTNSSLSNAIRKPYNAAVTGQSTATASTAAGVKPGTTSYAAALKLGGAAAGGGSGAAGSGSSNAGSANPGGGGAAASGPSDGDSGITSVDVSLASIQSGSTLTSASLSPTHGSGGNSTLSGGIDLQSLLNNSHIPGLEQLNRPFRSYSEPIVKIEGSSSLNGEILTQFDLNNYSRLGPSAAIGRSNNSSRSSSILATQSLSESGNSRRQSFDLLGSLPQQQQQHSVGLGQASNHTSSNSLANIPWLSSPPSLSLDAGDAHSSSGLHNSGHMPGPLSLLLPGPVATGGPLGGGAGGGSRNGGSTSSIGGSVTPSNTVENLFGLQPSNPPPPPPSVTSPTSFGGQGGITSLQALAQHQQQQYMQLQAQQAQQQQQLQQLQQQQLQAAYQAFQNSPHQSFNPGYGGGGSLLDASGLGMLPPAQHQAPSTDLWANMVMHQREQQQQHLMQQYPPYYDPHMHTLQQQQQQQQQQLQQVPQPVYAGGTGGGYFSPSGGSQPHPGQFTQQPQQSYGNAQSGFPGSPYFAGGNRSSGNLSLSPSSQALQQQSLPPPMAGTTAGLNFARSELSEGDDLFKFNDLHLDSAEFDPKAPWLNGNKH